MSLIQDSNYETAAAPKNKKNLFIILIVGIILLIVLAIALVVVALQMNDGKLTLTVDGANKAGKTSLINYVKEEDGVKYISIENLAKLTPSNGYTFKWGDDETQDTDRCYVENQSESTFFTVDSNTIYKRESNSSERTYLELDNKIISKDNTIYIALEDADIAMNMSYKEQNNKITLTSIGKWKAVYHPDEKNSTVIADSTIVWDTSYANEKLYREGLVVICDKNDSSKLGVGKLVATTENKKTKLSNVTVVSPKYKSIEYVEKYNQLIVQSEDGGKGVLSLKENNGNYTSVTKTRPIYNSIQQIDAEHYVVSQKFDANGVKLSNSTSTENKTTSTTTVSKDTVIKYGIVKAPEVSGQDEEELLPIEYDEVGIDISDYTNNGLTNKYLLYNTIIPVKKGNVWGFANLSGRIIIPLTYQGLGCNVSNKSSNVLIVPDIDAVVYKKDSKYGIMTKTGRAIKDNAFTKIYKESVNGVEQYSVILESDGKKYNLIDYINSSTINRE